MKKLKWDSRLPRYVLIQDSNPGNRSIESELLTTMPIKISRCPGGRLDKQSMPETLVWWQPLRRGYEWLTCLWKRGLMVQLGVEEPPCSSPQVRKDCRSQSTHPPPPTPAPRKTRASPYTVQPPNSSLLNPAWLGGAPAPSSGSLESPSLMAKITKCTEMSLLCLLPFKWFWGMFVFLRFN